MQQFQTYPLSSISLLRKNELFHVVDDNHNKQYLSDNLSRITSNDSGISYDDSDDSESHFSNEYDFDFIDSNYSSSITITDDGIENLSFTRIRNHIYFFFLSSTSSSNT